MLKKANISFSIAAQAYGNEVTAYQFSTQDKNSAKLIFTVKEGKTPLNLADIDGTVDLVMGDKSVFEGNKAVVTKPLDGELEYTITAQQIRHPGKAQGELLLTAKDGTAIGGFRFNFTIKKALVDEQTGPVKEYYIEDLEAIKTEIQTIAENLESEYKNKAYTVDEKLADVQATVTDLRENGTGIDAQARQEVQTLTTQLAENTKKLEGVISVKEFGAIGDGVKDDTIAIQAALDFAANNNVGVDIPKGTYKITAPLKVEWTATPRDGLTSRPTISFIRGNGKSTTLLGTIDLEGRAILELTGTGNTYAVDTKISDFNIRMKGGSQKSYCLKVGDCKEFFSAERIKCYGANGLSLKISSSNSYAQMSTHFKQCSFRSNYNQEWFADDSLAEVYAVYPESNGAKMDNVRFESCLFAGLVETRAHIMEFQNCQFLTNPSRPTVSGRDYGGNVGVRIGNATFRDCYFEDHSTAIFITPSLDNIDKVTIEDCHFSGVSNHADPCEYGVQIVGGAKNLGVVTINNCRFGDDSYTMASIKNSAGKIVEINNVINLQNPTSPIKVINEVGNFAMTKANDYGPKRVDKITFRGTVTQSTGTLYVRLDDFNNTLYYLIDRECWIERIRITLDTKITTGTLNVRILKNGATVSNNTYPSEFIKYVDTNNEQGYKKRPQSSVFAEGDRLNIQVISNGIDVTNFVVKVDVHLAY